MGAFRKMAMGLALAACTTATASAQEFAAGSGNGALFGFLDEVRFGGSFSLMEKEEGDLLINGQILMTPLGSPFANRYLDALLRPRPHLGGTVGTGGGINQVFAGLTWTFPVIDPIFIEASFGGTLHDGPHVGGPGDVNLGCTLMFRESAGIGVELGAHWRVLASVDHSSHAGLCDGGNSGITNVGAYAGYRF